MSDDTVLPFGFPAVCRKKVVAAFDGGRISSDGGVMLLGAAERRIGIAATLASLIADPRDPALVTHSVADILRARMLAIACGYEDADDLDHLRTDPGFKLACGRLPDSGADLCSQPTVSRWENAPTLREVVRLTYAMVDIYCASYAVPPAAVTLDVDDTVDVVHGHQQLALFNAHYDERCFLPIHIYEGTTGKPVAVILRQGKTPAGVEVRTILKHVIGRIRGHWPKVKILVRGDSHYGRIEAMEWCEQQGVDYIFGFGGNAVLKAMTEEAADVLCVRRATDSAAKLRTFATLSYGAKSWNKERRTVARIEATQKGLDIRYVVTSLKGTAKHLYETLYCGRGQAENFIKWHKAQLASDRTSCRDPKANQFRLILHTAAYWLMLTMRNEIAKRSLLAVAEFATLRLRLIKIAARVIEGAARIRVFLPTACPDRTIFRQLAGRLCAAGP
jgi:hypothetical protein